MSEFNAGKPIPMVVDGELIEVAGLVSSERGQQCDLCGEVAELRPYGPNGESICAPCGAKDEEGTKRQMARVMFGIELDALEGTDA